MRVCGGGLLWGGGGLVRRLCHEGLHLLSVLSHFLVVMPHVASCCSFCCLAIAPAYGLGWGLQFFSVAVLTLNSNPCPLTPSHQLPCKYLNFVED